MLAETFLRSRTERVIAGARVVVALIALLAVWLTPTQPAAAVTQTYVLLLSYVGFALLLMVASSRRLVAERLALVGHLIDLGTFTFLMVSTDGASSPFFLLFTFSVISATFRWQWRGALATAAAVLILFGLVALVHAQLVGGAVVEMDRMLLRCAHVVVVGAMLAFFGYYNERTTAELQRVSSWRADAVPRDLDAVLRRWITHVGTVFGSERVILVIDDPEEPFISAAWVQAGTVVRQRLPIADFSELVTKPLTDAIFLRHEGESGVVVLEPSSRLRNCRGAAVDPEVEKALDLCAFISAPVQSDAVRARCFVADPKQVSAEDLTIAGLVAEQLSAALDRLAAFDATKKVAASDERLRLARDLHDGVLQTLAGTALQLENIARTSQADPALLRERIDSMQAWLTGEQREMRAFIRSLRPAETGSATDEEAEPSLSALCGKLERQWDLSCHLQVNPADLQVPVRLNFHVEQLVREAAANAVRHGSASELEVRLESGNGALRLSIADNGSGLPWQGRCATRNGFEQRVGPRSLRERVISLGGRIALDSSPEGLRIEIELPVGSVVQAA